MAWSVTRRAVVFTALGVVLAGGTGLFLRLRHQVRAALDAPVGRTAPLEFLPVAEPTVKVARWGSGEVVSVAATPETLFTAGGSGIWDARGDLSKALPTLRASAMTLWRGEPVAALEAGGVFLRRGGAWEELRTGFGVLHARALMETPGGELLIGAREGLFKAAWGATTMEKLDAAAVKCIALGPSGGIFAGGETGLRRVDGRTVELIPTPDPWISWVGVADGSLSVLTPLGLARGPLGGAVTPLREGADARSAALLEGTLYAVSGGHLLAFDASGRGTETFPPSPATRVMTADGVLFMDTVAGLYRRSEGRWDLVRPKPSALPDGFHHVGALAIMGSKLAVGCFDGGLAVGDPSDASWKWRVIPGASAWGVNALLPEGGALFVASLRGAARFDGQRLTPIGDGGAAFSLATTPGGVAIGYGQGVALPEGPFLSAFHGLPGNQALTMAHDEAGLLFIGTPTGLGAIKGGKVLWRVTAGDGRLPNPWVNALTVFHDALFVGTYGGGIARRDAPATDRTAKGDFTPFPETAGLKVSEGCLVASIGTLFVGTDGQGLYRLSADGARFVPVNAPLPSRHITAILPVQDGLLVGTDEGLARLPLPIPGEGD